MNDYFKKEALKKAFKEKIKNSRSKGIDKISSDKFEEKIKEELQLIQNKIHSESYSFSYYLEKLILKSRNKIPRMLSIPTIRDRIVLKQFKEYLGDKIPDSINRTRPQILIKGIIKEIAKNNHYDYFIRTDLKSFYDKINRKILYQKLEQKGLRGFPLELTKNAVENITVPKNFSSADVQKYKLEIGVPQGLAISNILAQVYMIDFDLSFNTKACFYIRYVDDILILCKKKDYTNIKDLLMKELDYLDLELNLEKTKQAELQEEFEFLGYKFQNKLVTIADKNIQKRINLIAAKFTWFKNGWEDKYKRPAYLQKNDEYFQNRFLDELNNIISGLIINNQTRSFLDYFREINDLPLLFRLDKIVDRFFNKTAPFHKKPSNVKSFVRTYYEVKYKAETNYIPNVDKIKEANVKRRLLIESGYISENQKLNIEELENEFSNYINSQLRYNTKFTTGYY